MASYRFFAGRVHRQDLTGGDWTELTQEESNELLSTLGQQEEAVPFQGRVQPWMTACFGAEISADRVERGDRLLEEVFELLQSGGYDPSRVQSLRDYVWGREIGEPAQEVGGVMVTLAAYCLAHGLDMHAAGETELVRIWTKVEKIRAKQAAKPKHSPLPQVGSATPAAKWRQEGKEDPHGKHYDCERAQLAMGDLTDDEMANAIFMADRSSLDLIAYQTAAKDRIRWLSRALEASLSNRHQAQRDEAKQAMMAADWIWRDEK